MLSRHIDVLAIGLIALGMLAFQAMPHRRPPVLPAVSAADFRFPNGQFNHTSANGCPLVHALVRVLR